MKTLSSRFATNLRSLRETRRLTQQELAARAKISVSYVSMLERGQRSPPLDTLEHVARALHVRPTALLQKL